MFSPDPLGARVNNWLLLAFGGCTLLLYYLLPVPFIYMAEVAEPFNRPLLYLGLMAAALLGIVLPLFLLTRFLRIPFRRQFLLLRPRLVPSLAVTAATLSLVPSLEIITYHTSRYFPPSTELLSFMEKLKPEGGLELVSVIVALALAVPLAEELLFRGLFQRVLLRSLPATKHWLAIVLVAMLFGALHPLYSIPGVLLLGLFFGFLTYLLGNLVYAILAHAVWNMTNLLVLSQTEKSLEQSMENPFASHEILWFLGSAVLFVLFSAVWFRQRDTS